MKTIIHNEWQEVLESEFESDYYTKLHAFLKNEYLSQTIYPDMYHIFEAFELTPFSDVKVVILGQDPYHGPNQAHGLSFRFFRAWIFRRLCAISIKSWKAILESSRSITVI